MTARPRVVLITHDRIGPQMAGPAIRCLELGRGIASVADVVVASALPVQPAGVPGVRVASFAEGGAALRRLVDGADVLVLQGLMTRRYPFLLHTGAHRVMDLYDPFQFEAMSQGNPDEAGRAGHLARLRAILDEQMRHADLMLAASERQRDMWLGRACALGLLQPDETDRNPDWDRRMMVVPFGLHPHETASPTPGMRGTLGGIGPEDPILLWGGGVWDWFDPLTLIRSIGLLAAKHPDLKLVFMGTRHPSPDVPPPRMLSEARALAAGLGLAGRNVLFHDGWVPYDERVGWYAQADIGVTAHLRGIETRYSFRTRVLDYMAAGLPLATTEGDGFADLVAQEDLGVVMSYDDVAGWRDGLDRLLRDRDRAEGDARRMRVRNLAARYQWSRVAEPLAAWIATDRLAAPPRLPWEPVAPRALRQARRLKQWLDHRRQGGHPAWA